MSILGDVFQDIATHVRQPGEANTLPVPLSPEHVTDLEQMAWCLDYPPGFTVPDGWPAPGGIYQDVMPIYAPISPLIPVCILAHGAGAPMDSPFMTQVASHMAQQGVLVVRFNFSYMQRRQSTGRLCPPPRAPVAQRQWSALYHMVQRSLAPHCVYVGGKSFGGRMAVAWVQGLALDVLRPQGIVVFGYPFYPAGRPGWDAARCQPLTTVPVPTLIVQGTRDALGDAAFVSGLTLSSQVRLIWLPDGDHSFCPRRASGYREEDHRVTAATHAAQFIQGKFFA